MKQLFRLIALWGILVTYASAAPKPNIAYWLKTPVSAWRLQGSDCPYMVYADLTADIHGLPTAITLTNRPTQTASQ